MAKQEKDFYNQYFFFIFTKLNIKQIYINEQSNR